MADSCYVAIIGTTSKLIKTSFSHSEYVYKI